MTVQELIGRLAQCEPGAQVNVTGAYGKVQPAHEVMRHVPAGSVEIRARQAEDARADSGGTPESVRSQQVARAQLRRESATWTHAGVTA